MPSLHCLQRGWNDASPCLLLALMLCTKGATYTSHTKGSRPFVFNTSSTLCSFVLCDPMVERICKVAYRNGVEEPRVRKGPAGKAVGPHVKYASVFERV